MSSRYTADGRRISSMTHARRGHACAFCDKVAYGNGGQVSHARSHVRRGDALELVKRGIPDRRTFLAPDDERLSWWTDRGYKVAP